MTEERKEEESPVVDRRRFTPEGELRIEPGELDNGLPGEVEEPAEPMVPAAVAQRWEERARAAEAKLMEVSDGYRRAQLDLEATRSRLEREQENRVRDALGRAFSGILAALDNLERAIEHAPEGPLAEGVRLVHRQMLEALAGAGLERISVVGQQFDPTVAEAVLAVPAEAPEQKNTVIEEFRAGYRLGERVLRPAQVRVAM